MANIVVSALSTFNNKGLKKGKKEIGIFEKQVKTFGKTFAAAFSVTALTRFSREAVKAFAADEKAARALEVQLKNTGFQFSSPGVELYISNLQRATGVLDDELRPAFQQLLTVTGSITKSQDALNTALDVSAATGKSLTEVSAALTRAYSGNTAGLSRLGAGISKATLKAGDMDEILAELNKKFAGQAQARLTTYSGKMDLLKVASENVKEEIGKGIIGALDALSDDNSIENATTQMEDFGKSIGKSITGVGILIGELKKIPGSRKATDILFGTNIFSMSAKLTELFAKDKFPSGPDRGGSERTASRVFVDQIRRENKIIRDTNKARADELAKLKAKSEVDKLAEKFDVERIGLMKALNEATDEDTKMRIQSKIAILDNNEALAKKLNADLLAKQAADLLAESARKAAAMLDAMPNKFDAMFTNLTALFVKGGSDLASAMSLAASSVRLSAEAADFAAGTGRYAYPLNDIYRPSTTPTSQGTTNVGVTVNTGAVLSSEQDLTKYIQDAVATTLKGGGGLTPAGSIIVFQ